MSMRDQPAVLQPVSSGWQELNSSNWPCVVVVEDSSRRNCPESSLSTQMIWREATSIFAGSEATIRMTLPTESGGSLGSKPTSASCELPTSVPKVPKGSSQFGPRIGTAAALVEMLDAPAIFLLSGVPGERAHPATLAKKTRTRMILELRIVPPSADPTARLTL